MSEREELAKLRRLKELEERVAANRKETGLDEASLPMFGKDVVRSAGSGLARGTLGLGQLATGVPAATVGMVNWAARKAGDATGVDVGQTFPNPSAGGAEFLGQVSEKVNYRPKTTTGRYVKSIAESAPGAVLGPGTALTRGLAAAGSGVGAQLADDMYAGGDASKEGNPWARVVGALIGGAAPLYAGGHVSNAQKLIHEATKKMTPGDWARANRIQDTLRQNNMPAHLNSQLLGPRSTVPDLVGEASSYSHTRPLMVTHTQDAPKQAADAMKAWLEKTLPPQVGSRRELLGDIQETASRKIAAGQRLSNVRYTGQMPKDLPDYPAGQVNALRQDLLNLADSPQFANSEGGKAIRKFVQEKLTTMIDDLEVPVTNPYALNNAYKDLNALKLQEGWKGLPTGVLKEKLKAATSEFDAARAAKTDVMVRVVEPMQKGLTGDIARMGGGVKPDRYTALESAFNRVFTPDRNQSREIAQFAKDIGPDEFSQFFGEYLRKHVSAELNRASTIAGPYKFTLSIARTPEQQANLNAGLQVVAKSMGRNPQEVTKGFSNLMRAFDTYKDSYLAASLNRPDIGQQAGRNLPGLIVAPHSRAGRFSFDLVARKAYAEIADMATSPDGLKRMEQMARIQPTSQKMKAVLDGLVISVIQGMAAEEPAAEQIEGAE